MSSLSTRPRPAHRPRLTAAARFARSLLGASVLASSAFVVALTAATPVADAAPATSPSVVVGVPQLLHRELPADRSVAERVTSPDSKWVVFIGDLLTDGLYELFVSPIGGGSAARLNGALPPATFVRRFEISPDSTRVVYSLGELEKEDASTRLFSVPITGGQSAPLGGTATSYVGDFDITADSALVVFDAAQGRGPSRLYTSPIAGGQHVEINHALAAGDTVSQFEIAPDGSRVVYNSYDEGPAFTLHSVSITGGGHVPLLPKPKDEVGRFAISPDSKRVVYVSMGVRLELASVPIAGGQTGFLSVGLTTESNVDEWEISPDSRRVAFLAASAPREPYALYSAPIEGGTAIPVTKPTDVRIFRFTPDSTRIVYWGATRTRVATELSVVPVEGGTSIPLNVPPVENGSVYPEFAISPDSQRVVYVGDLLVDGALEIFSATLDGGFPARLNAPLPRGSSVSTSFAVMADGVRAVYVVNGPKDSTSQVFVVGVAGGAPVPLPSPAGGRLPERTVIGEFDPSADGRWVVFDRINPEVKQRQLSSFALFPEGASVFTALAPARLFDTRAEAAVPGPKGVVAAGSTIDVQIAGAAGVPAAAVAVALNVTATESAGPGFVTVWPTGRVRPVASSINVTSANQTRPNMVVVPIGTDGRVSLFAQVSTHLLADVIGYFTPADGAVAAGRLLPLDPARVFDTRADQPAPGPKGFVDPGVAISPVVAGVAGIPRDAAAVVLNVTATDAGAAGFVTVWPSGLPQPVASTLNLAGPGDTAPNLVMVPVGKDGRISLFAQSGAHLLADVTGYVTGDGARNDISGLFMPLDPGRVFDTRPGESAPGPKGFVGSGQTVQTQISGVSGVPQRVGLVALNVTASEAATGYVSAFPGTFRPLASTTNLVGPNDTRATAALTPLGARGELRLFAQSGAYLIADVAGYTLA